MSYILTEEQMMFKTSAKEYLKANAPISQLRRLRDAKDPIGYDRKVWKDMAEMGWLSMIIPEAYGGMDLGYFSLGQILEETGRTLTASPLISTILLGTTAILKTGSDAQKGAILPKIVDGNLVIAMAFDENNIHNRSKLNTTATKTAHGYSITGKKIFVLDGHVADKIIVVTKSENGISLFLVDSKTEGISIQRNIMMDNRNAATITFNDVKVSADSLLGIEGKSKMLFETILDIASIGLSAEMLGATLEAFERTIAYLKERQQFGLRIGSFQALQHRAAQMYSEIELCKTLVSKSLTTIDKNPLQIPMFASMTKAKISATMQLVSNEGIQMFGGIGMTDEEEIGFFLKRARVAQFTFGDENYHLDRFSKMNGF